MFGSARKARRAPLGTAHHSLPLPGASVFSRRLASAAALALASSCSPEYETTALEPVLAVSPDSLDFGDVVVDYQGTMDLELINAGRATLQISGLDLSLDETTPEGVLTHDGQPVDIPAGERSTVQFTCLPTTFTTYTGTLLISSNDTERPQITVPITCTGVDAPTPDVELDPSYLDFGTVDVGSSSVLWAVISNSGDGDLHILSTEQTGSGAFSIETDPEGVTVGPDGDEFAILVNYAPVAEEAGDSGWLTILCDDPDESELTLRMDGNGGNEDALYPVAIIDAVSTSTPMETISLDGTRSYDPDGLELTYSWTLTGLPEGSTTELESATYEVASLFLDLAGDYQVELVVENELGVPSAPAKHDISALPDEDLRVEMFWDTNETDVDLHLVQEGYELFQDPGDCNFCNPSPDWGVSGSTSDNPTLDLDDISGYGPENINIDSPADGNYEVYVHYFDDNNNGATTVTVRVYLNKEESFQKSEVLEHNDVWHVGTILWPDALVAEDETSDLVSSSRRDCY